MAATRKSTHTKSSSTSTRTKSSSGKSTATKTRTRSTGEHSKNPSSTGHGKAKKQPAKQTSHCWPGYEPVAGKASGEKGSCKPKAHQTSSEKKSDAMAASANKLRKAGSKARANHSK